MLLVMAKWPKDGGVFGPCSRKGMDGWARFSDQRQADTGGDSCGECMWW